MAVSVNIQRITRARARRISDYFSTVDLTSNKGEDRYSPENEVSVFLEGPGHEDAAARIAALINEQVVRRDNPPVLGVDLGKPGGDMSSTVYGRMTDDGLQIERVDVEDIFGGDDGPTYDGPDDENEALRMETEQNISLGQAREAAEEERAYNEEDRLGREAHMRAVRRDDKPWTPHEDEIERDVVEGRRDADGEPTMSVRVIGGPNAGATFVAKPEKS